MPSGVYTRSEKARKNISKARIGKHHSEKTKKKIGSSNSIILKGRHLLKETKEKISKNHSKYWLDKKRLPFSEETRKKMSNSQKGRLKGENHWNWKGGVTPQCKILRLGCDFEQWREKVFKRDNYTCQKTKIKGGKLHPHHIQNFADFPELRFTVDNGITLSEKSHIEFHKFYGKRNNTREQLEEFLNK